MSEIKYKLVYNVVKNWPLFEVLPLSMRLHRRVSHFDTPVVLGTNKNSNRTASSVNLAFQFTYSFEHLQVPQLRARMYVSYLLLSSSSLNHSLSVHSVCFLLSLELEKYTTFVAFSQSTPITPLCDGSTYKLFLGLKKVVHCPDPLLIHLACLAV